MMRLLFGVYSFFETLPDRCYPFGCTVNGRRVRGRVSYQKSAARAFKRFGAHNLGFTLTLYRQAFHFAGSVAVIFLATVLSKELFGSEQAIYILLFLTIAALTYQEFYVHPRRHKQHLRKGIVDWSFWVLPMLLFMYR